LHTIDNIFQHLVEGSPYPVYLISGYELVIAAANKATLDAWGKDSSVIGMRFSDALPELKDQPFEQLLKDVLTSGKPYYAINDRADLIIAGKLETFYFNFTFQPMFNDSGKVVGVMCYATDVSAIEKARLSEAELRRSTELAQLQLKLAVEGANLVTWHLNPETKAIGYSGILEEMFGYYGNNPMSYDSIYAQISPEFQQKVIQAINDAIKNKSDYDITYSQRRFDNNELIWLRSLGKAVTDGYGNYSVLSGVIMDVTKQINYNIEIDNLNRITLQVNSDLAAINEELAASNEEFAASNEEFAASNEELAAVNEELATTNEELAESHEELLLSENRFRSLIMQAPFAICVIRANDLMINDVNDRYLELVGKERSLNWKNIPFGMQLQKLQKFMRQ
jgi:two-component system sensor histidine kinase VicK